ncbi:MAG: cupin domain-containing protein [Thermoplasmata archaeon]
MVEGEQKFRGFSSVEEVKPVRMREGIVRKTLVYGDRILLCHWTIEAGTQFGEHSHIYEQAGFVIRGRLRMIVAGKPKDLLPGSAYLVPPNVRHDAIALEDVEIVDIFSPLREEYVD